jgi:4'-phosphopantetheinyl transferase
MAVRVWTVDLDQPRSVVADLTRHLDAEERQRAGERPPGARRDRYVVAHGALREVLAAVTGAAPRAVEIERRCRHCGHPDHGKPTTRDPELSFNLSHSATTALVAVARGADVGVDVEAVRARPHLERLAARLLTPEEHAQWVAVEAAARNRAFLELWTAKEARLKATGVGLTRPLRTVAARAAGWTVTSLDLGPAAVASVAVRGVHAAPELAIWTPGAGVSLMTPW